ncbi:MAG: hypothetical protein JEY94_16470 [Melioribacteraceae bacterium]|nr:hypothetical protein [Melioribacteraceae bacterium]
MLNGIVNIKTDRDFVDQKKVSGSKKFLNRAYNNDSLVKDSVVFSPGAIYLSKLNWNLKEINFVSEDKFHFDFFIGDIEFVTEVDLLNFYAESRQKYKLARQIEENESSLKIFIELSANKIIKLDDLKTKPIELDSLNFLFNRIYDMRINSSINKFDEFVNQNIASDISSEIFDELDFINNAIYNFLTKMGKFTFIKNYKFANINASPITIERILAFNAK